MGLFKILGAALLLTLFTHSAFAQKRIILRTNGEQILLKKNKNLHEAISETNLKKANGETFQNSFTSITSNTKQSADTIAYRYLTNSYFNTNFGFFSGDVMLMWFVAPMDLTIKAVGFTCSDDDGYIDDGATVGLRIVKLNWTEEQLKNFTDDTYMGYYPSDGTTLSNADFFGEHASGSWNGMDSYCQLPPWTNNANPDSNTFNYDLWSDDGEFFPIVPVKSDYTSPVYNWLEISATGKPEPVIANREVFAVVAKNNGINLDSSRIGFWSDNTLGYPGWKFYANGRFSSNEPGWWTRTYTWDFAVMIETTCKIPTITLETYVLTSFLNDHPKHICSVVDIDTECLGISHDNFKINLVYVLDKTDTNKVEMSSTDGYSYCGDIPATSRCYSNIEYWVEALDSVSLITRSNSHSYTVFCPQNSDLLVFNGYTSPHGYPQEYYWGTDTSYIYNGFNADVWSYGQLTKELVDSYTNIFEICTTGPKNYNNSVIRQWLEENNKHNYFLAGQEWLGANNNFTDQNYTEDSFEYDILGLTHSYNDINYDGTSGKELPSKITPIERTLLGNAMFQKRKELINEGMQIDSICYDPLREIGINNWLDGFDVIENDPNIEVFMTAETRGIMSQPEVKELPIGLSRTLPQGNLIAFMSFDPISINSRPDYFWFGNSSSSPQMQFLLALPLIPGVNDGDEIPSNFSLLQNYPNPFNPSTTIQYSIPGIEKNEISKTKLIIYDVPGKEVATLVNKEESAGNYEVTFNAGGLAAGIYFYKLQHGSSTITKKMMLLK